MLYSGRLSRTHWIHAHAQQQRRDRLTLRGPVARRGLQLPWPRGHSRQVHGWGHARGKAHAWRGHGARRDHAWGYHAGGLHHHGIHARWDLKRQRGHVELRIEKTKRQTCRALQGSTSDYMWVQVAIATCTDHNEVTVQNTAEQ